MSHNLKLISAEQEQIAFRSIKRFSQFCLLLFIKEFRNRAFYAVSFNLHPSETFRAVISGKNAERIDIFSGIVAGSAFDIDRFYNAAVCHG